MAGELELPRGPQESQEESIHPVKGMGYGVGVAAVGYALDAFDKFTLGLIPDSIAKVGIFVGGVIVGVNGNRLRK